ncbi:diguanylate cyclase (GGDEF) domain-containing protein [Pseudobutyrivibrio sp. YE44]|uniref:EAL domain-containing protein n=1 Tax=Pseudobutyrivibrio sp. YE44 TaxID=1520802 RepID=UPI0008918373|nr:EAL domain-containing protein [Pseudobutyrivibrio sp. YE44]SDB05744.1 diguanylate cyclase (GGDEF) domain-containing protein [Pseudobutyrivibrio sp. YE44]
MGRYEFDKVERYTLERLNLPMAIYQYIDKRVVTLLVTDGMCKLMGMERADVIKLLDDDMYRDTHPDDKARVADAALKFASGGETFDCVYRTMSHVLNDYVILHSHGAHFFTEDGTMLSSTLYMVEGLGQDEDNPLTEKLASNFKDIMKKESLIRDNFYDTLTGLPNMSYFLQLAESGKMTIIESGHIPGILFFDLTGMKFFNDKYGIREGDNLLVSFSMILKKYFPNENCGRMGSDHFAVYTKMEGIEEILINIFTDIKYANEGRTLPVHVGIYSMEFEDVPASTAFDRAKVASDKEKGAYVSKYSYYDNNTHAVASNHQYVINNFEKAMEERWIMPYYQQIIRAVNGLVCDEEALARWNDPVRGLIPPDHFIYVLEDVKLIHKLDLYILDRIIEHGEEVLEKGMPLVPVSLNLSKYDFELCDIVEEIDKRIKASKLEPDFLTIEVTESVSGLDPDFVSTQINRFHKAGFKVWMDDFGSGYSSLNMLQQFDFDLIKFDMRFMREFSSSRKNHIILRQLVQMAKKLGIDTLVEGVETIEQVKFLREIGVAKLQGYYFAKPIPMDEWYAIYGANIGNSIENENETAYYDAISRINVVEPEVNVDYNWRSNDFFGQLPTGILEFREDSIYIIRYNKTFAKFLVRADFIDETDLGAVMIKQKRLPEVDFINVINKCVDSGKWELVEGLHEQSMKIDLFIKFIGRNPITSFVAFEVVIIAISTED